MEVSSSCVLAGGGGAVLTVAGADDVHGGTELALDNGLRRKLLLSLVVEGGENSREDHL